MQVGVSGLRLIIRRICLGNHKSLSLFPPFHVLPVFRISINYHREIVNRGARVVLWYDSSHQKTRNAYHKPTNEDEDM